MDCKKNSIQFTSKELNINQLLSLKVEKGGGGKVTIFQTLAKLIIINALVIWSLWW